MSPKTDNDVMFRIWARRDAIDQVEYAREIGPKILRFFELYFDVPYPLPKQVQLQIFYLTVPWGSETLNNRDNRDTIIRNIQILDWCFNHNFNPLQRVNVCVLMVYCDLNNNTLKLLLKEPIFILRLTISFVSHWMEVMKM